MCESHIFHSPETNYHGICPAQDLVRSILSFGSYSKKMCDLCRGTLYHASFGHWCIAKIQDFILQLHGSVKSFYQLKFACRRCRRERLSDLASLQFARNTIMHAVS